MEFRVLGPVVVVGDDGESVELGGPKGQCVLAVLLLAEGKPVSVERLSECVWGDETPLKARETLHSYVSRLRKRLRDAGADNRMLSSSSTRGYRLAAPAGSIDVQRFEYLVRKAETYTAEQPDEAAAALREALALFDGEPLAGISSEWAAAIRARLTERRRAAVLARIDAEMRVGGPEGVIGELAELTARGPVDQTAVSLLMIALNNAGRPGEALAAYHDARIRLRESIGFEPRRELQDLHQAILRGEPTAPPPPRTSRPTPPVRPRTPNTLAPEPEEFVGRDDELKALLTLAVSGLRSERQPNVLAVDGMAGVGKTTLALAAAHRLADRFPDGLLQLDLRGHDARRAPMEPPEALGALLAMLGVPGHELGRLTAQDALAALWRTRTADARLLILLDDAREAEQVNPLIPTGGNAIVLVTSRIRLGGLERGRTRSIEPLPPAQAAALFTRRAGTDRIDEPGQAEEVARLCGGLPLALVVAAGHLRSRPAWRLRDLADRMAYARAKPDEGDQIGLPVNAAFALSYRALTDGQRRLFRFLGLHQGPEISLHAAAALHGDAVAETDRALDVLVGHHLLEEPERHRYRIHDLIRDYAAQRSQIEDDGRSRELAVRRLLDFYLFTADLAERTIRPQHRTRPVVVHLMPRDFPRLGAAAQAQTWLDAEHDNMMAAIRYAAENGFRRVAAQLPHVLAQHLDRQSHWKQAIEAHEFGLAASYSLGDRSGQATALTDLASARWAIGDLETAQVCAEAALRLWREVGDQAGESDALFELGRVHWRSRRSDQAADDLREAAALRARARDRRGYAVAAYHLAIVAFEAGRHTEGITHTVDALETARSIRDQTTVIDCLSNLGVMYERLERYRDARRYYRQAIDLAQDHGDPHRLAVLASNIGEIHGRMGDHAAALESFRAALDTYERLGDQRSQIDTLTSAADVYRGLGRHEDALDQLRRAAVLADRVGDPLLRGRVQHHFGEFHAKRHESTEALRAYRSALAQARRAAAPLEQAMALERIGDTLVAMEKPADARVQWDQALELFEQLDMPEAERLRQRLRDLDATA